MTCFMLLTNNHVDLQLTHVKLLDWIDVYFKSWINGYFKSYLYGTISLILIFAYISALNACDCPDFV